MYQRCPGSGRVQMLDWFPDDEGYPGAVVCIYCSYGVLIVRGSEHRAVSRGGHSGLAGKLRAHLLDGDENMKYATKRGLVT